MTRIHGNAAIDNNRCGCNDQPTVTVAAKLDKNRFGRGNWDVTFRNNEAFPVFVTMAVQEGRGSDDWDTVRRDVEIAPHGKAKIEVPACGNGSERGTNYRVTVRNKCDAVIDNLEGCFR